ncbi:protein kinase [Streptomyces sp. V4I8]|uniref:serine/threonine protein kinase n=1 Tax=Streptomyces sp. V4I8 TaxID=3156469 RepID=UPI0035147510
MWRAVDEILDRLVAVKEMRIDGLDPEDTRTRRERTLREARATARIDHPNVVRVYDVVDEGELLWIVMELVAGRSLERIIAEEGPLGPCETARIGIGLLVALRQVHARGVLHRDIKPGNVLVETEVTRARGRGRVVLTDFGIAAIQDAKALTMVGMLVGSPDYMAPERISGRPQGPPSDIWSLGATLSAALAGHSPFSRDTTLSTLHAVLYEEPELPPTAGPLRPVLTALLQKDPPLRPTLDALETALEPVAFPVPTPTMPVIGGGAAREGVVGPGGGGGAAREGVVGPGGEGGAARDGMAEPRGRGGAPQEGVAEPRGEGHGSAVVPGAGWEPESEAGLGRGGPGGESGSGGGGAGLEFGAGRGAVVEGGSGPDPVRGSGAEPVRGSGPDPVRGSGPGPVRGSGAEPVRGPGPDPVRGSGPNPERAPGPAPSPPSDPEPTGAALHEPEQTRGPALEPGQAPAPAPGSQPTHATAPELRPPHGPESEPELNLTHGSAPDPTPTHGGPGRAPTPAPGPGPDRTRAHGPAPTPTHAPRPEPTPPPPATPTPEPATTALPATPDHPSPGSAIPRLTWSPKPSTEAPTPAYLEALQVPPPADPRQPEDIRDAIPPQPSAPSNDVRHITTNTRRDPTPTAAPAPPPDRTSTSISTPTPAPDPPRAPNASTELASQPRSEVRSPTPTGNSSGAPPHRPGVSLARSEAVTERRPAPGPGQGLGGRPHGEMPPGELPGPAVPADPRRGRRRTRKVAALGIVAAGAAVAVILATTPGSPEDDQAGSGSSPSASSPTAGPSSTVEGTSRPQILPPGSRREAGGFAWVPPEDWRRDVKTGSEVHYTSPDAEQELAAKSSLARDDLMDSWQKSEEDAQQGQQYRKIRLERTTFRGHPAVVWEYTFTLQGAPWHAQLLGFTVDGKSYQINTWYRPDIETEALSTYEKVKDTFTVL